MQGTHEQEAYEAGVEAAKAAASWVIDGNTSQEHIAGVLALWDNGDPAVDECLPYCPDLSGQWAGDPTPLSLARDITGEDEPDPDLTDSLAEAFERGAMETFGPECERILRAAVEA